MVESPASESFEDIDWSRLWRQARRQKSWRSKGVRDWDRKAASFSARQKNSDYVGQFLARLDLSPELSVLDVGCGPGTLAIPIAKRVARVTAVDYSRGMLDQLHRQARLESVDNIDSIECAWEDDWRQRGIAPHDIVIASRSMNIDDLSAGLRKIDAFATRAAYVADRIDPSPFDPDAFAAVGRPFRSGPDYIFTVNMLYRLGIHPRIEHIELPGRVRFADLDEAFEAYAWMFRDLQEDERERLRAFVAERIVERGDDYLVVQRNHPQRWALLWWSKTGAAGTDPAGGQIAGG